MSVALLAGEELAFSTPQAAPIHNLLKLSPRPSLPAHRCSEAPFYTLGPLATDIAPAYDHM